MSDIELLLHKLETVNKELNKHEKILNGNGREGLITRVSKMSAYLKILLSLNIGILTALIYLIVNE
jgi:hypothetical protein